MKSPRRLGFLYPPSIPGGKKNTRLPLSRTKRRVFPPPFRSPHHPGAHGAAEGVPVGRGWPGTMSTGTFAGARRNGATGGTHAPAQQGRPHPSSGTTPLSGDPIASVRRTRFPRPASKTCGAGVPPHGKRAPPLPAGQIDVRGSLRRPSPGCFGFETAWTQICIQAVSNAEQPGDGLLRDPRMSICPAGGGGARLPVGGTPAPQVLHAGRGKRVRRTLAMGSPERGVVQLPGLPKY